MGESETEKRPSNVRIRTLRSDIEEMRNSGGQVNPGRILGQKLEDLKGAAVSAPEPAKEEAESLFQTEGKTDLPAKKKSKILPAVIIIVVIFILGGASVYFLLGPKADKEEPTEVEEPKPVHVSLFANPVNEKIFTEFSGQIDDFEKIIAGEFRKNFEPQTAKEIVFLKDKINSFSANEFLGIIFSDFSGVNRADIPDFEDNFSFIIYNPSAEGINYLGYVLKMNTQNLPSFALSNLKTKFNAEFEKFIENNSNILSSQYLQDVGKKTSPFLSLDIGPIKARYIKFSAGSEFYYGWYQNSLLIATNQETFLRLLTAFLPKI